MSFLDSAFAAQLLGEAVPGWTPNSEAPKPWPDQQVQPPPAAMPQDQLASAFGSPPPMSDGGGGLMPLPTLPTPMSDTSGGALMPMPQRPGPGPGDPGMSMEGAPAGAPGPNPPPGTQFAGAQPPMPTAAGQPPPYPPGAPVTVGAPALPPGKTVATASQPPNGPLPAPPPMVTGRAPVGPGGAAPPAPRETPAGHWLQSVWKDPRMAAQMGGSLGAGLKAVGQNWNKPGLAAFAGTAGSALEGGQAGDDHFFNKTIQAKEEARKYHDAYLKDATEANRAALTRAMVDFRRAQTEAIRNHGTIASRNADWRSSDLGRLSLADNIVEKRVEGVRKSLNKELNSDDPKDRAAAQQKLEAYEKDERAKAYKAYGWTPEQADKIRNRGNGVFGKDGKIDMKATEDNAFRPQSQHEFNTLVQVGNYFVNTDGKLYKRTQPAPPPADAPGGVMSVGAEPGPQEREQLAGGEPADGTG
jgi:hypothetical protein